MPDDPMRDDLEFESQITDLGDRQLMEFIARQSYATNRRCKLHELRIATLEKQRGPSAKFIAAVGAAVGGTISGIVYGMIVLIKKEM